MLRSRVQFQWAVGEESAMGVDQWEQWRSSTVWPALSNLSDSTVFDAGRELTEHKILRWLTRCSVLLVCVCLLIASNSPTLRFQDYLRVKAEIDSAVRLERRAILQDNAKLYSSLVKNRSALIESASWLDPWRIQRRARQDVDLALVDIQVLHNQVFGIQEFPELIRSIVLITPPKSHWVPVPYHETRFYHQADGQWQRIVPPFGFLGDMQTLETDYFHFIYFEADSDYVVETAETLDKVYTQLLKQFETTPTRYKLEFSVEPRVSTTLSSARRRIAITSPSLYRIPATATGAEYLTESTTGHLVNRTLSEVMDVTELYFVNEWYNTVVGVRGWVLREILEQPPSAYQTARNQLIEFRRSVPELRLTDLTARGQIESDQRMVRFMAAESLTAYAMETYGEERLLPFLQGFMKYETWDELIPNVFGVGAAEFERGWNGYLDTQ